MHFNQCISSFLNEFIESDVKNLTNSMGYKLMFRLSSHNSIPLGSAVASIRPFYYLMFLNEHFTLAASYLLAK